MENSNLIASGGMSLSDLGWTRAFAKSFAQFKEQGYAPGRVACEQKNRYTLLTEFGEVPAVISGRMSYDAVERADLPVVGDWVAAEIHHGSPPLAAIHAILPRRGIFSRKAAGRTAREQPVAANIDTVFLVMGLDGNYNPRRLERYLALACESGADPVVLLTKRDICPEVEERLAEIAALAPAVPVHAISVRAGLGLEMLLRYQIAGNTIALLGSSGVGKSTLLNHLLGREAQTTLEVREDDSRGRHATTHRELFLLPTGALMIDTPGMRELHMWGSDEGIKETFAEIAELAQNCRFADCRHENEPGCRVQQALREGILNPARFESYQKLQKEIAYLETKVDIRAEQAMKEKWKNIHKQIRQIEKNGKRPTENNPYRHGGTN